MQKSIAALLQFCLVAPILLISAHADNTVTIPNSPKVGVSPATKQFVAVYFIYARAIRDHGVQGVKEFTTPDFVLRSPGESSSGPKAYKELSACIDCFRNACLTASVHPLTISKTEAVALTRETFPVHLGATSGAATYYWKQTWRMTPQGWKLAVMETDRAEAFDKVQGLTFTTEPVKDDTAKAQGKQNMVE